eukprot:1391966-Rhodomonas_salina.1
MLGAHAKSIGTFVVRMTVMKLVSHGNDEDWAMSLTSIRRSLIIIAPEVAVPLVNHDVVAPDMTSTVAVEGEGDRACAAINSREVDDECARALGPRGRTRDIASHIEGGATGRRSSETGDCDGDGA